MKALKKILKGHKHLIFVDLEGTQFSHEIIAIGAVVCTFKNDGSIKKYRSPFKCYCKARNQIGKFVTNLTGITEEKIAQEGISYSEMMEKFRKYLGTSYKHGLFITFGSHDIRMFNQSQSYNLQADPSMVKHIKENHLDFLELISEFIRDDKNNPLSLTNYCKLFDLELYGVPHDPVNDAMDLAHLYDAFVKGKMMIYNEYKKTLLKYPHLPKPLKEIVNKLCQDEVVTPEFFNNELKKYIDDKIS